MLFKSFGLTSIMVCIYICKPTLNYIKLIQGHNAVTRSQGHGVSDSCYRAGLKIINSNYFVGVPPHLNCDELSSANLGEKSGTKSWCMYEFS